MIKYTGYTIQNFSDNVTDKTTFYQGLNKLRITMHFTHNDGDDLHKIFLTSTQLGSVNAVSSGNGMLMGPIFVASNQRDVMLNLADFGVNLSDPFFIIEVSTVNSKETLRVAVDLSPNMLNNTPFDMYANMDVIDAAGRVSIDVFGTYNSMAMVNGVRNFVTISWQYKKVTESTWSAIQTRQMAINEEGLYQTTITITGLNSDGTEYEFLITADDLLNPPISQKISSTANSIFDWSDSDFRVNVPARITDSIELANEKPINGLNRVGASRELMALKSDNGLHIGLGPYSAAGEGPTYIYGNQINMLSNGPITMNGQNILNLINALTQKYTLNVDLGFDSGFTTVSATAYLIGTNLYLRYRNTQSMFNGTAYVKTLKIYHDGKITDAADIVTAVSTSGSVGGMQVTVKSVDDTAVNIEIVLSNVADATNVSMGCFVIPVAINVDAYNV